VRACSEREPVCNETLDVELSEERDDEGDKVFVAATWLEVCVGK